MKLKHYIGTAILALGSLFVLGFAAAQDRNTASEDSVSPPVEFKAEAPLSVDEFLEQNPELGPIPNLGPDITLDEANKMYRDMSLYAALLERQFDAQEAVIIELRAEIEALRAERAEP